MNVKIVNKSNNPYPRYETAGAAGVDLRANLNGGVTTLYAGEQKIIPTGLFMEIPEGYEGQVRPRSGMAAKHSVTITNTPGTIDCDYRGEILIILINLGKEPFTIQHGDRIAQMVFSEYDRVRFDRVDELSPTERGEGGHGHTGTK